MEPMEPWEPSWAPQLRPGQSELLLRLGRGNDVHGGFRKEAVHVGCFVKLVVALRSISYSIIVYDIHCLLL